VEATQTGTSPSPPLSPSPIDLSRLPALLQEPPPTPGRSLEIEERANRPRLGPAKRTSALSSLSYRERRFLF
jgi:hypothetical protein